MKTKKRCEKCHRVKKETKCPKINKISSPRHEGEDVSKIPSLNDCVREAKEGIDNKGRR